jgi:DNA sulfur modification protein DndD
MILEQLTLLNFCLFAGTQTFDLTPVRRNGKHLPIILFGGINGGGKTTLLDAIQLALYGPRARCSKRFNVLHTSSAAGATAWARPKRCWAGSSGCTCTAASATWRRRT